MNIRILLILLAVSLILAFTRRWRIVGLVCSVVLAVLLVWFTVQQPGTSEESGVFTGSSSSSSAAQTSRIAPVVTLQLEGNGAPWRVRGSVVNPGDVVIRSITLQVERLDCPLAESIDTDCDVVWQAQHAAHEYCCHGIRIDDSFYSHEPVPRLKGVARDRITVVGVQ
jgi:hypothetical protein